MMLKCALGTLLVLFCLTPSLSAQQLNARCCLPQDGSVIQSTIIEQIPGVPIKIKTRDGNIFFCKMEEITKTTKEPLEEVEIEKQSPALAFVLSFILPGLGQFYNEEITKGITQLALVVGGYVMAFTAGIEEVHHYDPWGRPYYETEITPWFLLGLGTAAGASIWSMIDAPLSASRINRERAQQKRRHLIEFSNDKYVLGLDLTPRKQGMEAKLTLHF